MNSLKAAKFIKANSQITTVDISHNIMNNTEI